MRRELEEKKRKEGKIKPPQYTPKQLEAIKNQKLKEQEIRRHLTEVNMKRLLEITQIVIDLISFFR